MAKISVIGAGSFSFSNRIIPDLLYFPELRQFELCLMDINSKRLELVGRFASSLATGHNLSTHITTTTRLEEALTDAAYVVVTFDIGGLEARRRDIEIPASFGICHAIGDTLGPAGIFNALRMAPELHRLARMMQKICPEAVLINYTNPMSINLRVLHDIAPEIRMIGFCHGLEHSRAWLARLLNRTTDEIKLHCAGINHQMWMLQITDSAGNDLYPELRETIRRPGVRNLDRVRFELMELAGYYMTESSYHTAEYVPYFQREFARLTLAESEERSDIDPLKETAETEALLAVSPGAVPEKRWTMGWGDLQFENTDHRPGAVEERLPLGFDVQRIEKFSDRVFDRFRQTVLSGRIPALSLSVEYLARLIFSMETGSPCSIYGNVENRGRISNLPAEAIVEVPVRVAGNSFEGESVGRLPEFCAALNRNFLNVALLVAEAVRTGKRHAVVQALAVDPITCANGLSIGEIRKLEQQMYDANAPFLEYLK